MDNDRDLLLVSVFTFLTVFLWIFFELVQTTKTTTVAPIVQQVITPFSASIDTDILTVVAQRTVY